MAEFVYLKLTLAIFDKLISLPNQKVAQVRRLLVDWKSGDRMQSSNFRHKQRARSWEKNATFFLPPSKSYSA
jgi:hypothetical protein